MEDTNSIRFYKYSLYSEEIPPPWFKGRWIEITQDSLYYHNKYIYSERLLNFDTAEKDTQSSFTLLNIHILSQQTLNESKISDQHQQ